MPIELIDVSFSYPNGHLANENLNLNIKDGERLAIVGQNGAGKTTAVKLMNGIYKPTSGKVLVNGVDTQAYTTAQIAKSVGYVFQNPDEQIFNQSVIDELAFMLHYLKLDEKLISQRIDRVVELTQLQEYLKSNPYDVPYPIRKFVTIAAILATEPDYIILDEPTAGQDEQGIEVLKGIMNELEEQNIGVVTITHDMEFVADNFERVVTMANKKIIADDTPRNIFWNDEIIKEAKIKKPQIAEVAQLLNISGQILSEHELVKVIK